MALIMVDVQEAAHRLDELIDSVTEGDEEVIISRAGRGAVLMVPFEGRGRPGAPPGPSAGRAGAATPREDAGAPYRADREIIVERMVGVVLYLT